MKATSAALRAHLDETVTTLATLWRIARQDGQVFYFTDHDRDIVFGGFTYQAGSGYTRTAIDNDASLSVDNLDVEGIFNGEQVSEIDMRAGLFDYAEVHVLLVNWNDLTMGSMALRRGRMGEMVLTDQGTFRSELRGMSQQLSQNILQTYQPECRADLGDTKCKFPIQSDILPRNTAVALGEFYRVSTSTANFIVTNSLVNPGFEQDALSADIDRITGWSIVSGKWGTFDSSNEGLSPDAGSQYLQGGASAGGEIRQDVDVLQLGYTSGAITAGTVDADFVCRRANSLPDDTGQVIVEFLDSDKVVISTPLDTTSQEITPEDTWATRSFTSTVLPSGTRYIRVRLLHILVTGGVSNAAFDNLSLGFEDSAVSPPPTQEQYENRIYEVTVAGTTAGSQPAYSIAVDATTVDGTATMTAREAFTREAEVVTVTDRRVFTIAITDPRDGDGWFNGGGAVFETGTNVGRTLEVKDYVLATNTITLFLPAPFDIQVGSKLRIYSGCDKRRTVCRNKFVIPDSQDFVNGNVINFRGEPDLTGLDDLVRYPDAN